MKSLYRARRVAALALTAVAVVGVAACGDDNSSSGGGTNGAASGQEKAVEVGSAYVGGAAGKADASKSPVSVGWVNQDESPSGSVPENTDALNAAVKFVNGELGGIDGHPIKVVQCTMGATEQQGKQCAQKFLNDANIKAVLMGQLITGAQSFMSTMAPDGKTVEKPIISFAPSSFTDGVLTNAYFTGGGFLGIDIIPLFFKDYFKAGSVSQIWSDNPALTPFITATEASFKKVGVTSKIGRIPSAGTDVVGPLVAGGVKTQDSIMMNPDDTSQCIAMAKGVQQLGVESKPTVGYSSCLVPAAKQALGDYPKWSYYRDALSPNLPDPSGQVDAFKYAIQTYVAADKQEGATQGPFSAGAFGIVMLLAKWGNATGPDSITNASLADQAKALTGPIFMGYPEPKFGQKPYPSIASVSQRYYDYEGDGKWSDATGGKWLTLPAAE